MEVSVLILSGAAVVLGLHFASEWRKRHQVQSQADLAAKMVEAGMSADDIVRVLKTATNADVPDGVILAARRQQSEVSHSQG
jgi:hypothetical protein